MIQYHKSIPKLQAGIRGMRYETLLFDVRNNVAHITLNRPEGVDPINEETSKGLTHPALCYN